ncbi:MAG: hypothetical protein ACPGXL_08835, partial [Chitinophagales bacterium]
MKMMTKNYKILGLFLGLCLLLLSNSTQLKAQAVLDSDALPQVGDEFELITVDFEGFSELASGANIIWDFETLPTKTSQMVRFEAIEDTPFATEMAEADFAITYSDSIQFVTAPILGYEYVSMEGGDMRLMGESGIQELLIPYQTQKLTLPLPFTYQNTASEEFSASYLQNEDLAIT